MNVKHTLKVLLCLMLSPRALAQEPATLGKVIGDVGNQYIASQNLAAPQTQSAEEIAKQLNPSPFNLKWTPRELSEYDRYNITRGIFQKNLESTSYSSVVAPLFFKKMELFCGGENTGSSLFATINRTSSLSGRFGLIRLLIDPQTDVATIEKRQAVLKKLIADSATHTKLANAGQKIARNENQFLLFWQPVSGENKQFMDALYLPLFSASHKSPSSAAGFKRIAIDGMTGFSTASLGYIVYSLAPMMKVMWQNNMKGYAIGIGAYIGVIGASLALNAKNAYMFETVVEHLHDQMNHVALLVDELNIIDSIVQNNPTLKKNLGTTAQTLHDNLRNAQKQSDDLQQLLKLLKTATFKSAPSFFANQSKVMAAYRIALEIREELAPALIAAGEIEAFAGIATLYKEHETKKAKFTFVDFVKDSTTPVLRAQNFWNPFVPADVVVTNSFEIGADKTKNAIITGPNTGGKSTVLKALLIDLLFAQTFGIAPADKLEMTVFNKINCYMNITDDIATGTSLFKAEVLRAKELINAIRDLPADKFSFTIMDEVFSGTSPKEGEEAAYLFAKQLTNFANSTTIIATHFAKLTNLPADTKNGYHNYHVEVTRNDDGTLNRTFLLKEGPSFMNVAMDILAQEGVLSF